MEKSRRSLKKKQPLENYEGYHYRKGIAVIGILNDKSPPSEHGGDFLKNKCKANLTLEGNHATLFVKLALQNEGEGDFLKNRIEEIRKERGIRQEEFAKTLGVSRQTISSLETGRYNPSIFLAYKIARYFGMTIEEVFLFDEE